jgi:dolichol-phosphate mannosyltransferase
VSVIFPFFNEEESLNELHRRPASVLPTVTGDFEMILVGDCCTDGSPENIRHLANSDTHARYVTFSRDFGHEPACTAGLERAKGEAVVLMDADLRDPPELIPAFLATWREVSDIVYSRRRRIGESAMRMRCGDYHQVQGQQLCVVKDKNAQSSECISASV